MHYQNTPEATERKHVGVATHLLRQLTGGAWPAGWYTGRDSPNTRRLVAEHGGYEYDSDYYGDDLPFWLRVRKSDGGEVPHLVVPYSLDTNDMRFVQAQGFNTGEHFFTYLRDAFDALYAEGDPSGLDRPKMMSIGMHCRLLGKPGRIGSLQRFLDHVQAKTRRVDLPPHRHRAALEGDASVRCGDRFSLGMSTMPLTLDQLNVCERRRVHRAARRHLRTLAVDRRARCRIAAVPLAGATQARARASGARLRPRHAVEADPRSP